MSTSSSGALLLGTALLLEGVVGDLRLTVLHNSDMLARFEETNVHGGACRLADNGDCYGGFARLMTAVTSERTRARLKGRTPLFLNAGSTFHGTAYYTLYKHSVVARFIDLLGIDVMSLGVHEFDDGVSELSQYLHNVTTPSVACNLDLANEPGLAAAETLSPSVVLDLNGTKVGIVGYLTPLTQVLSDTGHLTIQEEVASVQREAERLGRAGARVLIALGHSGLAVDREIARRVADIDLVVGGLGNTFLYNGATPSTERVDGPYPWMETQPSGRRVPVVHAYAFTKYLGVLELDFDRAGELTSSSGNPILLQHSIAKDAQIAAELDTWTKALSDRADAQLGFTRVSLDNHGDLCSGGECNWGNMVADAFVEYRARQYSGADGWTDAAVAIVRSAQLGSGILTANDNGNVTVADVVAALPLGNTLMTISLTGRRLQLSLEWAVLTPLPGNSSGYENFLQVSGLLVVYNVSRTSGHRVTSVQVRCASCLVPTFLPLNLTQRYTVLMDEDLARGGGFPMFIGKPSTVIAYSVADVVMEHIQRMSPIYPAVEWRITLLPSGVPPGESTAATLTTSTLLCSILCLANYFTLQ